MAESMLIDFILSNRLELIARTRSKIDKRLAPRPTELELESGVPLFLDRLAEMLSDRAPTSPENGGAGATEGSAAKHGAALLGRGYTVAQVVFDYGDICQAVTELANETRAEITTEEFQTLNLCLDRAIAEAVTEYARLRDQSAAAVATERSGVFAHELRNKLSAASLAHQAIKSGRAPNDGSVAAILTRSLQGMTTLLDRVLVEVRLDAGNALRQRVHVHQLLEDAEVDGTMEAGIRGVLLSITPMERNVDVNVDPHILGGVVANLLQNAIKFTRAGGHVELRANVTPERVVIEVEDECGGLPPAKVEELFGAFQQRGKDRSGLGLGLFISRKGVEASGGSLRVRDVPGRGCVFTIDLPRMPAVS